MLNLVINGFHPYCDYKLTKKEIKFHFALWKKKKRSTTTFHYKSRPCLKNKGQKKKQVCCATFVPGTCNNNKRVDKVTLSPAIMYMKERKTHTNTMHS